MKSFRYSKALAAVVLLGCSYSSAGEKLHLQSGSYDMLNLPQVISQHSLLKKTAEVNPQLIKKTFYHILQFETLPSREVQNQFENQGVRFVSYIPDDAYVVRAEAEVLTELVNKGLARAYAPYRGRLALTEKLVLKSVFDQDRLRQADVHIFDASLLQKVVDEAREAGASIEVVGEKTLRVLALGRSLQKITEIDGVQWVSEPRRMQILTVPMIDRFLSEKKLDDEEGKDITRMRGDYTDLTGKESGTAIMNFPKVWEKSLKGEGQIVAIADTGLDMGNQDQLATDFGNFQDGLVWGIGETSWMDVIGHGTHVTGSVGGSGSVSQGWITGGATASGLLMQSLWSRKEQTLTVPEDLGALFGQAYERGARIHTNSWGDPFAVGVYDKSSSQADQFMWEHPDMLILFAAGNSGVDADKDGRIDEGSVTSPATAKNIISVGASENEVDRGGIQEVAGKLGDPVNGSPWSVDPIASSRFSDNSKGIAAFSSRGPTKDQRIKPDIVAPGTNILSNCSKHPMASEMWGSYNTEYCFSGGTSMATPLTAGAAAIVRQYLVKKIESPSAALVKAVLLHTATDLYPGQFGEVGKAKGQELLKPGPNSDQGYGRVDVLKAVTQRLSFVDEKVGLATGESRFYELPMGARKVTLVYTDYPAAPNAATALVNDLDIEIHTPTGIRASDSRVNNTEQVSLDAKTDGPMTVYVRAKKVPFGKNGKQPYALVIN